jgi:hypothetical protein
MGCFQSKVIAEFEVPRRIRRVGPSFTIYGEGGSITYGQGVTYSSSGNPRPDD